VLSFSHALSSSRAVGERKKKKKKSSLKLNRLPKGAVSLEGQLRSFGISTVLPPRTLSTYASPAFGLEELT
jgi:hypothetical protein